MSVAVLIMFFIPVLYYYHFRFSSAQNTPSYWRKELQNCYQMHKDYLLQGKDSIPSFVPVFHKPDKPMR